MKISEISVFKEDETAVAIEHTAEAATEAMANEEEIKQTEDCELYEEGTDILSEAGEATATVEVSEETGEESESGKAKEPTARRSGKILTAERGGSTGGGALRREAEKYHFYEAAKFNRDPMHRPVFYGRIVSYKRQTIEGKVIDFALVEHKPEQLQESAIIYIPAAEVVSNEERVRDGNASFAINAMIGAIVEFIVTGVVREFGMIVGSRKLAMKKLQETYYGGEVPQIYADRRVEARVMSVSSRRMTLDVFGVETVVQRVEDFQWGFAESFNEKYEVGDKILVRVENVDQKNGEWTVGVTGRMETESPDAANMRHLTRGSTQLGKVTRYYNGIYFVRLSIGVNAVIHVVQGNSACAVGDMVKVRVTGVDRKRCQAKGTIVSVFK